MGLRGKDESQLHLWCSSHESIICCARSRCLSGDDTPLCCELRQPPIEKEKDVYRGKDERDDPVRPVLSELFVFAINYYRYSG